MLFRECYDVPCVDSLIRHTLWPGLAKFTIRTAGSGCPVVKSCVLASKDLAKGPGNQTHFEFSRIMCIYIYFITWIYSVSHDILRYGSKICQTPRSCVVLGVPKPNVSYSIIVPLEAINPGIYHIFVSNAKWTKQCYLHSFWSPKKHVQGPAKHARKTYRKCWRFLPLPVFNTDKQETCCFVRNGPVIRKKNET